MHPSTNQPLWNIPYRRNPFFTGREDVLSQLHHTLHAENAVALSHAHGISGLGGIGKTQTALEYAYHYGAGYDAVFWVQADSTATLTSSFVTLAHLLRLPERDEQDLRIIVAAVLYWLRLNTRWLLVFDNIDDLSVAEPFLPKVGPGHILFTTRMRTLGGVAQYLEVQKMEPETGALLLLRKACILPLQVSLDLATSNDRKIASKISQELDGLPLALDQAGAYIKETPCTLTNYLVLYQARHQDLLQIRGSLDNDYPASVATTWSLSFERVRQASPAATELLTICAFLAPDAIPEEVITEGAQHLTSSLQTAAAHPLQFDQAIAALLAYSLVSRDEDATLNIHRLVQVVLRDKMTERERKLWVDQAARAVKTVFPEEVYPLKEKWGQHWGQRDRLIPHLLTSVSFVKDDEPIALELASLLFTTANYMGRRARYTEAESLYERAWHIREHALGPLHPDVAHPILNLSGIYIGQGKYVLAEFLLTKGLRIWEQALGPEHPDVSSPLTNLAHLYSYLGKYTLAESFYKRAILIQERELGSDYPDLGHSLRGLGYIYLERGEYIQATLLFQRAEHHLELFYGYEHPELMRPLTGLAIIYQEQGQYREAERLFLRAQHNLEQVYDPHHPILAESLTNLANLYQEQGRYTEAEQCYRQALHILKRAQWLDLPEATAALNGLANLSGKLGTYTEAAVLYQQALHIREHYLGKEHPRTGETLHDLATFQFSRGNLVEAESLYQRALIIREQQLGRQHPKTQATLERYIILLQEAGRSGEATALEARFAASSAKKPDDA